MEILTHIPSLSMLDGVAAGSLLMLWLGLGYWVEHSSARWPSVNRLMTQHRREWMVHYISRNPRVTDATLLASLREGTSFFASACLIALGGGLALIGNTERLDRVAEDLMLAPNSALLWELKILLPLALITNAFLKFVWSTRVWGYCAVMMGAVPNDPDHSDARRRAMTAAELNIEAAKAFNRGLRSVYFALGALGWLLGAQALIVTTVITAITIWHREFNSRSRQVLLEAADPTKDTELPPTL